MAKIKLPWYTCSRIVELYGVMGELEAPPPGSLETLRRINETAEETTSGSKSQSERPEAGHADEAHESTPSQTATSGP